LTVLHTARLRLEPITRWHLEGIYAMDSDPEVARYVDGEPATREQTADWISRVERCWAAWGFGWWAFVEPTDGRLVGAGCIQYARREAEFPLDPNSLRCNPLELGWRLHRDFWRRGLASEAAARMASYAFEQLDAQELIAVAHPDNTASTRVMERLRMRYRGLERWYGEMEATYLLSHQVWRQG
jgi:RimJ/RimL family protein N-acetyltransferase